MKIIVMPSIAVLGAVLALTGCATGGSPTITRQPTDDVSTGMEGRDLEKVSRDMVESMLTFPPIVEVTQQRRPVIHVHEVRNKTSMHMDTEALTDTISTQVLRSGKFRFVDRNIVNEAMKEMEFGQSGLVDESTAAKFGRMIGADYILYGNVASIETRTEDLKDVYMRFTMKLVNIESNIVEWQDQSKVHKRAQRSTFGV